MQGYIHTRMCIYRYIHVYVSAHIWECVLWAPFYKHLSLREAHSVLGAASFRQDSSWVRGLPL